ncbi:hypothetical protein FF2_015466 [Malus domestica]
MASFKLITFVPVFILLHLIQSTAHTHGAMNKVVLAADETGHLVVLRRSLVDVEKEIHDGVPAAVEEAEDTRIGGRKMMPERNLGMVKVKVLKSNGERRLRSASSSGRVKVKLPGFIPFDADYHVPKPHPPKNN